MAHPLTTPDPGAPRAAWAPKPPPGCTRGQAGSAEQHEGAAPQTRNVPPTQPLPCLSQNRHGTSPLEWAGSC